MLLTFQWNFEVRISLMKIHNLLIAICLFSCSQAYVFAQDAETLHPSMFDDKFNLDGYTKEYSDHAQETLIAMIQDDTLNTFKMAAAVRVFKDKYCLGVFSKEKKAIEKILWRRLHRTNSPFVQVEIMHTLCRMDRYTYFNHLMPTLIIKLDHYNNKVNETAYTSITDIIETGHNRAREARIVFSTLRKLLFLMRKRLANIENPDNRLKQKLTILRWSIKVLGSQELKRLPKEVLHLL